MTDKPMPLPDEIYVHRSKNTRDSDGNPNPDFLWLSYEQAEEGYEPHTLYRRADLCRSNIAAADGVGDEALKRMADWVEDAFNGNPYIMETLEKDVETIRAALTPRPAVDIEEIAKNVMVTIAKQLQSAGYGEAADYTMGDFMKGVVKKNAGP